MKKKSAKQDKAERQKKAQVAQELQKEVKVIRQKKKVEKKKISFKDNVILGFLFAFSVFSKYPSIIFIVPILYAYLSVTNNLKIATEKLFVFGCAVLTFSFLISPYFFLDISKKTKHYIQITKIMIKKSFQSKKTT